MGRPCRSPRRGRAPAGDPPTPDANIEPKAPVGVTPPLILTGRVAQCLNERRPLSFARSHCARGSLRCCARRSSPPRARDNRARSREATRRVARATARAERSAPAGRPAAAVATAAAAAGRPAARPAAATEAPAERRTAAPIARCMGGMMRGPVTAATGTTLVKVNTAVHHQHFEGWGTSLCWWANHVGGWAEAKRNALVDNLVDATNGLGYNVFRYNIGGGENPTHTHMGQFKNIPGFEPSSGTWDWTADANQRAILQRIVTSGGAGVILEAFSNSPPYWMTNSGCASGATSGCKQQPARRLLQRLRRLSDRGGQALPRHLGHHFPNARAAQRAQRHLVGGQRRARRLSLRRRASADHPESGGRVAGRQGPDRHDRGRLRREQHRRRLQHHARRTTRPRWPE